MTVKSKHESSIGHFGQAFKQLIPKPWKGAAVLVFVPLCQTAQSGIPESLLFINGFFPLKYVTTEKNDTSTFCVLPCNFFLEVFSTLSV